MSICVLLIKEVFRKKESFKDWKSVIYDMHKSCTNNIGIHFSSPDDKSPIYMNCELIALQNNS